MNNFIIWGTSIHELVRILCLQLNAHEAFRHICINLFCIKNSDIIRNRFINSLKLRKLAKAIYVFDREEKLVASCYSVSLTIFYLAGLADLSPTLIVGAKKADERLLGHAWVKLKNGVIINPGNECLNQMQILHEWNLDDGLETWARGLNENMVNRL